MNKITFFFFSFCVFLQSMVQAIMITLIPPVLELDFTPNLNFVIKKTHEHMV